MTASKTQFIAYQYTGSDGEPISYKVTQTGTADEAISEAIANATSNYQIGFTLDQSSTQLFWMVCDQNVTVKFNDTGSPTPEIELLAGIPYVWHADSYEPFLLTVDVTTVYVTNNSGHTANFSIGVLRDATPQNPI